MQIVNKAALGDLRFQALLLQYGTTTNLTLRPGRGLRKMLRDLSASGANRRVFIWLGWSGAVLPLS
jgi:hypothetical protein